MRRVIDDLKIRETIGELANAGERVTARRLRAELKSRFGHFGNSVRVHRQLRLLRQAENRRQVPDADLRDKLEAAVRDAESWKNRAELAQHRERTHQDKWALEIHQLREELRTAKAAIPKANALSDEYLKLYNERERLKARNAELEMEVRGEATNRDPQFQGPEAALQRSLGCPVQVRWFPQEGRGRLDIRFRSIDQLDGVVRQLAPEYSKR